MSSTTAISVPITPVAAAARGPATNFATAAQAVTITAAARRTTTGEATWDGESRLTMMPTATIATMSTRETNHSLLSTGCADVVTGTRPFEASIAPRGSPSTAAVAVAPETTGVQPGRGGGCPARPASAARPCDRSGPGIARPDEQHDRDQDPRQGHRERGERPGRDPGGGREGRDDHHRHEPCGEDRTEAVMRPLRPPGLGDDGADRHHGDDDDEGGEPELHGHTTFRGKHRPSRVAVKGVPA